MALQKFEHSHKFEQSPTCASSGAGAATCLLGATLGRPHGRPLGAPPATQARRLPPRSPLEAIYSSASLRGAVRGELLHGGASKGNLLVRTLMSHMDHLTGSCRPLLVQVFR